MRVRNHGKYTKMSLRSPRAIGRCDYSGLMVRQTDMVEQLAYRGTGLVKTGYRVNPKFYDEPNSQDLIPLIRMDPIPVLPNRPDNQIEVPIPSILYLDITGDVTLTASQFANLNFVFRGSLSADTAITVPNTFNQFFVLNETTGGFDLLMQTGNPISIITLPPNQNVLVCVDDFTISISHPN